MNSEIQDSIVEWNRKAALEEIELLKVLRSTAWDEHTHSFRWLMASLLGINGAACLGILNLSIIPFDHKLIAGGSFFVGILTALLVAVFGQHSVQKSLAPLQKQVGYWMTVAHDGERNEELESTLNDELKASARVGLGGRFAGWISALSFVVGALTAGAGMKQHEMTLALKKQQAQVTAS